MIPLIPYNKQGFAIGNGLTNPEIQYQAYTDYALDRGLIKKAEYNSINKLIPPCKQAIEACGINNFLNSFPFPLGQQFTNLLRLSHITYVH